MKDFFVGFWKGFGRVVSHKVVGPLQVVDFLTLFNFLSGIYVGWGNMNSLCGWFLAAWFYLALRIVEGVRDLDKQAIEDATVALRLASEAMERQQERIENQQKEIEALKNRGL
jgi:hypothetical protein